MYHETERLRESLTLADITWWKGYSKQEELTCWRDSSRRFIQFSESAERCKLIILDADSELVMSLIDVI